MLVIAVSLRGAVGAVFEVRAVRPTVVRKHPTAEAHHHLLVLTLELKIGRGT